ncbi:hypothetical protein K435DRAFT_792678 [Dendrothele bispora CBS 962.96]|uniref:Nephrocystin 3-like N-terminal domain-containing protein n=1 Tax=Dendrothele bispora (strain CBS 962.96) TaxID=1314807 RepID=A0A4S8MIU1_DENBC|nr:hypothetical protein K435DRAFT_792678 [Dendrothele bispora CBS 962.96]
MRKCDQVKRKIGNTVGKILGNKERNDVKDSLETSLKILKEISDINPILKSAVDGTSEIIHILTINKLEYSVLAFHNAASMNRSQCTEGTRIEILNDIMKWAEDCSSDTLLGYWMYGMAGTGKSTIAKSLCLKLEEKELLAGSFFCSRQYSCKFAQELQGALEHDQDLAQKEPSIQVEKLLIQPWKAAIKGNWFQGHSAVVVIDALDECENISRVLKAIVPAIQQKKMQGLKFFFTSRPEGNISDHLHSKDKTDDNKKPYIQNLYLHNVEESLVQDDIKKFLREQLQPLLITEQELQTLVQHSGRLFIYAATTAKYITNAHGFEKERLKDVLQLANVSNKMQTERIDELYDEILKKCMENQSSEERYKSKQIVYTVLCTAIPASCFTIAQLLSYDVKLISDIKERIDNCITEELEYCCFYWAYHLEKCKECENRSAYRKSERTEREYVPPHAGDRERKRLRRYRVTYDPRKDEQKAPRNDEKERKKVENKNQL